MPRWAGQTQSKDILDQDGTFKFKFTDLNVQFSRFTDPKWTPPHKFRGRPIYFTLNLFGRLNKGNLIYMAGI
jgi:hypothetical protein